MILYPAIDLKDGQAVRLYKGEMDQATVFNDSPADQALAFEQAGCSWIHLVDLNGAFAGTPVNDASVRDILSKVSVPCQLGGGIRDMATIATWIDLGLSRVILGTVAVENPALVREAAKAFPGKIAVGLDARDGRVATRGWATETDIMVTDLAKQFEQDGIAAIIYRYQPRWRHGRAKYRRHRSLGARRVHPSDCLGRGFQPARSTRIEGHGRDLRRHFRARPL